MQANDVYITEFNLQRLKKLIREIQRESHSKEMSVHELENELDRAIVVSPKEVPENVITMNSRVVLRDIDSGKDGVYWLVFPDKADNERNYISVLNPLGKAMIGSRVGDTFIWESPSGAKQVEVLDILYQPERMGNFTL